MRQAWSETEEKMIKRAARTIYAGGCSYYQAIKHVREFLFYRSWESVRSKLKRAVRVRDIEVKHAAALRVLINDL